MWWWVACILCTTWTIRGVDGASPVSYPLPVKSACPVGYTLTTHLKSAKCHRTKPVVGVTFHDFIVTIDAFNDTSASGALGDGDWEAVAAAWQHASGLDEISYNTSTLVIRLEGTVSGSARDRSLSSRSFTMRSEIHTGVGTNTLRASYMASMKAAWIEGTFLSDARRRMRSNRAGTCASIIEHTVHKYR